MSPFNCQSPVTAGVYTALASIDVSVAFRFLQQYQEPNAASTDYHLSSVNRFWREQLGYAGEMFDTLDARAYLIDRVQLHDWLRMFAIHVAPVIVNLNLPQRLPEAGPSLDFGQFQFA